jgi:hypothetical protein
MNDLMISKKIQSTRLFSDAQKVAVLVAFVEASDADKKKLEAGIDAFDKEYATTVAKHTQQIKSVLGHIHKNAPAQGKADQQEAQDKIDLGLAMLSL